MGVDQSARLAAHYQPEYPNDMDANAEIDLAAIFRSCTPGSTLGIYGTSDPHGLGAYY
jgi:hypothetical protein